MAIAKYMSNCYIASAETKRDWLVHGHVALDKCNVSLGQQVNNCCGRGFIGYPKGRNRDIKLVN